MQKPFTLATTIRFFSRSNFRAVCLAALTAGFCVLQARAQCPDDITVDGPGTDTWQAPATGGPWSVQITAVGAGGGNISIFGGAGGGGATMIGTFVIQNSQTIRAIAGGPGGDGFDVAGGGGGGSGAVNCGNPVNCNAGTILILAAGGNGEGLENGTPGSATQGAGAGGPGGAAGPGGGDGLDDGGGGGAINSGGISSPGAGGDGGDGGDPALSYNTGSNQSNSDGAANAGPVPGQVIIHCIGALPVELINFKAVIQNEAVRLLWSTATEKENLGYDVERSADGRNWTTLGFVPGNGNTNRQMDYNFADNSPSTGVNYYRLKQMDTDGDFEYSPMVIADVRAGGVQFDIYPNPSTDGALTVRAVSQKDGEALLEMYDWVGYKVYKETVYVYEGTVVYPISMAAYPKGAYTARIEMPDGTVLFRKIMLQ